MAEYDRLRVEALQYLDRLVASIQSAALSLSSVQDPWWAFAEGLAQCLAHAGGAAEALSVVGVISDSEHRQWQEHFRRAARGGGAAHAGNIPGPKRRGDAFSAVSASEARMVPSGRYSKVAAPAPASPDRSRLVRLINGPDIELPYASVWMLRIIAVEQYEAGIAVQWLIRDSGNGPDGLESDAVPPEPVSVAVEDSVGTMYTSVARTGGGRSGVVHGRALFLPDVPSGAEQLILDIDGLVFIVHLI